MEDRPESRVKKVYCAPGNAGIARLAECLSISAEDVQALTGWAEKERIDLTVVGPEAPLTLGIAEAFQEKGMRIFGPSRKAAKSRGARLSPRTNEKVWNSHGGF